MQKNQNPNDNKSRVKTGRCLTFAIHIVRVLTRPGNSRFLPLSRVICHFLWEIFMRDVGRPVGDHICGFYLPLEARFNSDCFVRWEADGNNPLGAWQITFLGVWRWISTNFISFEQMWKLIMNFTCAFYKYLHLHISHYLYIYDIYNCYYFILFIK